MSGGDGLTRKLRSSQQLQIDKLAQQMADLRSNAKNGKPNPDRFIAIISVVLALLLFLLQVDGVDINWQMSLALYLFLAVASVVSSLRHAVPHYGRIGKTGVVCLAVVLVGSVGFIGTWKQYKKEHASATSTTCMVTAKASSQIIARLYFRGQQERGDVTYTFDPSS